MRLAENLASPDPGTKDYAQQAQGGAASEAGLSLARHEAGNSGTQRILGWDAKWKRRPEP